MKVLILNDQGLNPLEVEEATTEAPFKDVHLVDVAKKTFIKFPIILLELFEKGIEVSWDSYTPKEVLDLYCEVKNLKREDVYYHGL